jgi:hypothetical protein
MNTITLKKIKNDEQSELYKWFKNIDAHLFLDRSYNPTVTFI